ncbi:hypothetical protein [Nocardia sp. NPDC057227]|uniref:hypothetical protein n=1 Tax=Nocardia sp. NPDC057227 TaxID=3346056 RepID=UPI00363DEFD9
MTDENPRMRELIENSLGTPAAKRLRESVPVEVGREIVRRAEEKRAEAFAEFLMDEFSDGAISIDFAEDDGDFSHVQINGYFDLLSIARSVLAKVAAESSPLRADLAPRSGAAHPDPVSRDGGTGSGCASNP